MTERPRITNAPGLTWRFVKNKDGWEALWRARADLVKRGYTPKNVVLWTGRDPSERQQAYISDQCVRLQDEMLIWGRGGVSRINAYDGTLRGLVNAYQTHSLSTWHKLRWHVRRDHGSTLRRVVERHGHELLRDIEYATILEWHAEWTDGGVKVAMGAMLISLLRTMCTFGRLVLTDGECRRISEILHLARFPGVKPRTERLTVDQVNAIRAKAHEKGWHSIALAQAFQFDLMLRQRDAIGEWVPIAEPGVSETTNKRLGKWLRGLRWSEIDENLILRHTTSKKGKDLEVDLKLAPMVMEELEMVRVANGGTLPVTGPVVICDWTGLPWAPNAFGRYWRELATACGIPKTVRNMDTRAGAISEATLAGADLEHIKHAATHSDISMTQRYARAGREKTDNVLSIRAASRNKPRTDGA